MKLFAPFFARAAQLRVSLQTSQRWGVLAFVRAVGMADARRRCERRDARCLVPTVLAGIGRLLASFVKRMTAFVRAIRMANAGGRREARDR